ncbi:MAG: hypothetical protein WD733_01975 [Bryobacterales bacterium]
MVYLGFLLTCLMGCLLLPPRWKSGGLLVRLSFGFALGVFAVSVQMFAYSLAGVPWTIATLMLPWIAGAAAYGWFARDLLKTARPALPGAPWAPLLVAAGILLPLAIWLPYERLMPLTSQSWDAWAIWLFKAKAFYVDGGIRPFLTRSQEFTTQPGYPLLVPLYVTFLYVFAGGVAEQTAKLLSPLSFVALLGVFYYFARRYASSVVSAVFTCMLATVPVLALVAFELAGYADTTLSLYLLAAGGFLTLWTLEGRTADLVGASLAATAAAWTKNEGQFFLLAVVLVAAVRLLRTKAPARQWLLLVAPPLLVMAIWHLFRQAYDVEAAGFTLAASFQPEFFRIALRTMISKAFQPGLVGLSFVLLAGAALATRGLRLAAGFWIVPGLVLWHLSGALLAYSTGRNDIHWWLGTSADRILSQVVPLALLPAAWVFGRWAAQAAESRLRGESPPETGDRQPGKARKTKRSGRVKAR